MKTFLRKHAASVIGVLSGFDRLVFRGTLRNLAYAAGLNRYLSMNHVLLKNAGTHFEAVSEEVKTAAVRQAERQGRPVLYLPTAQTRKEALAREMAAQDRVTTGLICVLRTVELCSSFEVYRNRATHRLELRAAPRKCLHYYHYWLHPQWGLMHVRLQTWFPFTLQVCLNGREWLARTLDRKGLGYRKRENCFLELDAPAQAQRAADAQVMANWPKLLDGLARQANPACPKVFGAFQTGYYWSAYQTEWATDVLFKTPAALAAVYPQLLRHGMTTFHSPDVLRFLGQAVPATGRVHGQYKGEVLSDQKTRIEGTRIKHCAGKNSVKLYDKQGQVLRVETTINDPRAFKVYRAAEGGPSDKPAWRRMRRGVADLRRRAAVSQASNERYLEALATVEHEQQLAACLADLCRPLVWAGRRARALSPFGADGALLDLLGRGEFAVNGFRNRDVQAGLNAQAPTSQAEQRRRSSAVTRQLRLLRAHGLLKKVPHTQRYQLTEKGRLVTVALSAAKQASIKKLTELAA